jgi:hypothetical protein
MSDRRIPQYRSLWPAAVVLLALSAAASQGYAQQPSPSSSVSVEAKPFMVEWVYKVKWGHDEEFWQLFKKYQIAILNYQKQTGDVLSYKVYRPAIHTGEDTRWEYRVEIVFKNKLVWGRSDEVGRQIFPDQATYKREENRRWELT